MTVLLLVFLLLLNLFIAVISYDKRYYKLSCLYFLIFGFILAVLLCEIKNH